MSESNVAQVNTSNTIVAPTAITHASPKELETRLLFQFGNSNLTKSSQNLHSATNSKKSL
jgi:hypothetical protein